jgi:dockerin type I repeat protein
LDPVLGGSELVVDLERRPSAIAFDTNTDTLYAAVGGSASGEVELTIVDLATGAVTTVGEIGMHVDSMAFDPELDKFYAISDSDTLIEIDPVTGAGTIIATGLGFVSGLAYVPCLSPGFVDPVPGVSVETGVYDGYIDPRLESDNGVSVNRGLDTITMRFSTAMVNDDGSPVSVDRFSVSSTGADTPSVSGVSTEDGRTFVVELDGIIPVGEWTTSSVANVRGECGSESFSGSVRVGFLPGDVDQNGMVSPFDLLRLRVIVNGEFEPERGSLLDFADLNRSGTLTPTDVLALRQLIVGVSPATQAWGGVSLPDLP